MGKWSISDLDKSKTEQSIANETIRLEHCKVERDRLFTELCRIQRDNKIKEENIMQYIDKIDVSIKSGEQFIKECQAHLKDFENAETN